MCIVLLCACVGRGGDGGWGGGGRKGAPDRCHTAFCQRTFMYSDGVETVVTAVTGDCVT